MDFIWNSVHRYCLIDTRQRCVQLNAELDSAESKLSAVLDSSEPQVILTVKTFFEQYLLLKTTKINNLSMIHFLGLLKQKQTEQCPKNCKYLSEFAKFFTSGLFKNKRRPNANDQKIGALKSRNTLS